MAKENEDPGRTSKLVALIVRPKQRFANLFVTVLAVLLLCGVIAWNALRIQHAEPINVEFVAFLLGALLCLMPLSEEWSYLPWQDAPRKMEHEIRD